jgi:eukaryotic-like serine/threonine-protein kinase
VSVGIEEFGKYILLEKIASGGMAEVYLAKSTANSGISKFIAIKRILPQFSENPEFIEMFKEEAKIAANLNHGNVVSIFEFGVERSQFFLVMEYVEGQNLRQVLNHLKKKQKYFSIDQIVYSIKEVAAGLDHAHRCLDGATGRPLNITHRDMSPQNIMMSFEGEVKIVDFGIAKAESQMEHTRAGTIKGKFGYMSPEQAEGQPTDLRTDIFSLGIILWELLANDRLFVSNSELGTLKKIRECQIPPLRKLNPSVLPELERICNKALAKDKSLRYQTAAAFHRDLNRFLNTQYPEFSPHDFSVFMKSAFSEMFIENRKKLIDYAKIQGMSFGSDQPNTVTISTVDDASITQRDADADAANELFDNADFQSESQLSGDSSKVDLSDLKTKDVLKRPMAPVSKNTANFVRPGAISAGTMTNTRTSTTRNRRPQQNKKPMAAAPMAFGVAVLAIGGLGLWLSFNNKPSAEPVVTNIREEAPPQVVAQVPSTTQQASPSQPEQTQTTLNGSVEAASTNPVQPYVVIVESNPSGARVYMDGKDTGMITPLRTTVDSGKDFTVTLRLAGYQVFEKKDRADTNGMQVKAVLSVLPKMGYLNLDLVNAGRNPIVTINGQRLNDKPPLRNYPVLANTTIRVEAHNPFTGLSDEHVFKVKPNERTQVRLILSSKRKPANKRK